MLAAGQTADLTGTDRQRTALLQQPLRTHLQQPQGPAHIVVERARLLQLDDHPGLVMVLQIGADFRGVDLEPDAMLAQQGGRADARQLQQLRRLQRTGGQQHFAFGTCFA